MRQSWRMLVRDWRAGELGILAAALVLVSDHPWSTEVATEIRGRGLEDAAALNFMSMAMANGQNMLAGVKAVTSAYPLRGRLRIAPAPGAPDAAAESGPRKGTVWIEERLVAA